MSTDSYYWVVPIHLAEQYTLIKIKNKVCEEPSPHKSASNVAFQLIESLYCCLKNRLSFCFLITVSSFHLEPLCEACLFLNCSINKFTWRLSTLWCLNMLISQGRAASDAAPLCGPSIPHIRDQVHRIHHFFCCSNSYTRALESSFLFLYGTVHTI